ncbi:MAG: hypothetical protein ABII09_09385 [Planctomycetota bacterium]
MMAGIEELEARLDSFEPGQRMEAIEELCEKVSRGQIELPKSGGDVNLHCHTFFSYNSYGHSPSKFAWLAKEKGLAVAGVVDFDVLDGLQEFLEAAKMLGLKGCAGMETRVYVPQFGNRVINSPGEPGISYHMGMGFPSANLSPELKQFQMNLQRTARQRNIELTQRVNKYLSPVELVYEKDVLPLTPSGNATERHICLAYARKAKAFFGVSAKLTKFWSEKLGTDASALGLPEGQELLNALRNKTMKRGGVGYIVPDKGAFPEMTDMDKFSLAAGAMPTMTWLNGTSEGEQSLEELIEIALESGVVAFNVIPDRNYTAGAGESDAKFKNLKRALELADCGGLPIVCGTEMNSPNQKFVDDFKTKELSHFVPLFLKGAYIVYGHSVLQRQCGLGYTSEWAKNNFASVAEKNEFFREVGERLEPAREETLAGFDNGSKPDQILAKTKS